MNGEGRRKPKIRFTAALLQKIRLMLERALAIFSETFD